MTEFIHPTTDLLSQIESQAGEVLPPRKGYRTTTEFYPAWDYILTPEASTKAVVAALALSYTGVPDELWDRVIPVHCPQATALLAAYDVMPSVTPHAAITGAAPALLIEEFARTVNTELGGYAVLVVPDTAAMVAEVIATLGAVPIFEDP